MTNAYRIYFTYKVRRVSSIIQAYSKLDAIEKLQYRAKQLNTTISDIKVVDICSLKGDMSTYF
jgi:hypothetical protein